MPNADVLVQLGVGGFLAIIILREVFNFILKWRGKNNHNSSENPEHNPGNNPGTSTNLQNSPIERREGYIAIAQDVSELRDAQRDHNIHAQRDREEMNACVGRIETALTKHGEVLQEIATSTSGTFGAMKEVKDRLLGSDFRAFNTAVRGGD